MKEKNKQSIKLIRLYQKTRPFGNEPRCRHIPSCSQYSTECYERYNFFKATWMTTKRILGCTPLNKNLFDPVPMDKFEEKEFKNIRKSMKQFQNILLNHFKKYPEMEIQDFIKLIYQSTYGPKHLGDDFLKISESLKNDAVNSGNETESNEEIGSGYYRLYLATNSNIDSIIEKLKETVSYQKTDNLYMYEFCKKIELLSSLIENQKINLDYVDSLTKINDYLFKHIRPISHSDKYNELYNPHYIVLKK